MCSVHGNALIVGFWRELSACSALTVLWLLLRSSLNTMSGFVALLKGGAQVGVIGSGAQRQVSNACAASSLLCLHAAQQWPQGGP